MLRWASRNRWAILATMLAAVLALGWAAREQASAEEKGKLLAAQTINLGDVKFKEFVFEGKPRGEIGVYFDGETAGTRNFVVGQLRLKFHMRSDKIEKRNLGCNTHSATSMVCSI